MKSKTNQSTVSLSYKFQRLREKLRQSIESGELSGKLPGERVLAKRFHVNSKTLSKALTDLAAEGLLDRSIGRGTFVKGAAPRPATEGRWMLLCESNRPEWSLVQKIMTANPMSQIASDVSMMRPSFLNQFTAVVDFTSNTPDEFLRSLVVRNIPVVMVGRQNQLYSVHGVLLDTVLAASNIGRDLLLGGHRRLATIEGAGRTTLTQALRAATARYAPDATVDAATINDLPTLIDHGVTAIVCESAGSAKAVRDALEARDIAVPGRISVAAVGWTDGPAPASGYFVKGVDLAEAIIGLLKSVQPGRPTTLWLAGESTDAGTTAPLSYDAPASVFHGATGALA